MEFCQQVIANTKQHPRVSKRSNPPIPSRPFLFKKSQDSMTITIKQLKGSSQELVASPFDTILHIKSIIGDGKLLLKGKGLNDLKTLFDYGITDQTTLIHSKKQPETVEESVFVPEIVQEKKQEIEDDVFYSKLKTLLDTRFDQTKSALVFDQLVEIIKKA
jgi:hypothetical protein